MSGKKLKSIKGFPKVTRENIQRSAMSNDNNPDPGQEKQEETGFAPTYISRRGDVITGRANSQLIFHDDRVDDRASGLGLYSNQAHSITLITGRPGNFVNSEGERRYVDDNHSKDAAKIVISQLTNPDKNFHLADGEIGNRKECSAVQIKADEVRIMSRGGIKLCTKTDKFLSNGNPVGNTYGIDLIAGNRDRDLQPLVKGDNLVACLATMIEELDSLNTIVSNILINQSIFNKFIMAHIHPGLATIPSVELTISGVKQMFSDFDNTVKSIQGKVNYSGVVLTYLKPIGGKYICSSYNNTN